jgi:hypothetical protein
MGGCFVVETSNVNNNNEMQGQDNAGRGREEIFRLVQASMRERRCLFACGGRIDFKMEGREQHRRSTLPSTPLQLSANTFPGMQLNS